MKMTTLIFAAAELIITIMCGIDSYIKIINYLEHNNNLDLLGGVGLALAAIIGLLYFIGIIKEY